MPRYNIGNCHWSNINPVFDANTTEHYQKPLWKVHVPRSMPANFSYIKWNVFGAVVTGTFLCHKILYIYMLISKVFDFCNITSYIFNLHQFNYLHAKFQIDSCTGTPCSQKHGPVTKFPLTSLYAYKYIYIYIYI